MDSAVINGAVSAVQEEFNVGAASLGFAVASALLGAAAGALSAGRIADHFGRLTVMRIAAVLFLLSALGTGFAPNLGVLIVFRIVGGLGVGMASVIAPAYIAEIAPARIRGRLGFCSSWRSSSASLFHSWLISCWLWRLAVPANPSGSDSRLGSGCSS